MPTTTTPSVKKLIAFHGNPKIKAKYIARMKAHAKADEIVQGATGHNGKGCAVWCTLNKYDHRAYETEIGIPMILARLDDRIFEGLSKKDSLPWPLRFLEAAKVGADLSHVWDHFAHWMLVDPEHGVVKFAKTERSKKAIQDVAELYFRRISGNEPSVTEWSEARSKAYAASYAAYAADAAADARQKFFALAAEKLLQLMQDAPVEK